MTEQDSPATGHHEERGPGGPSGGGRGRRGPGGPRGRGPGGPGGRGPVGRGPAREDDSARTTALDDAADGVRAWLEGRVPAAWSVEPPAVEVDRDEVSVVLTLTDDWGAGAPAVQRFREETREERIALARSMERQWNREVSWGAVAGEERAVFTSLSVPTMTRLRQPERRVLDVLVDSGVARSRSDALAWCVRLVATSSGPWLTDLRTAMRDVDRLRAAGPTLVPPGEAQAAGASAAPSEEEGPPLR